MITCPGEQLDWQVIVQLVAHSTAAVVISGVLMPGVGTVMARPRRRRPSDDGGKNLRQVMLATQAARSGEWARYAAVPCITQQGRRLLL